MKRNMILALAFMGFLGAKTSVAQNIAINATGATPDNSAVLDVSSTDKGVLVPRIALTATNSASPVTSPAFSLLVFNTATAGTSPNNVVPGFYYWNGTLWVPIAGATSSSTSGSTTETLVFTVNGF